ncbi:MAG: hypothetical protein ACOVQM_14545, partial [Pirellula sp.]
MSAVQLDPSFDDFHPYLLDGRYILWESNYLLAAIDLEDIKPTPFSLEVSSISECLYYTNPTLRVTNTDGARTVQLVAIEDHSIAIRNEWFFSANSGSPLRTEQEIYTLNQDDTFIEKHSSIDGSFISRFPIPMDPTVNGILQPQWNLMGGMVCAYSRDLQLSFVYDFVHQRTLFTPSDPPAHPLTN